MKENLLNKLNLFFVSSLKCVSFFIAIIVFFSVFSFCSTQKVNQSSNDLIYKKENNQLNAQFFVYHLNDSVSKVYYKIPNELFLYKKSDTCNFFYSNIKLALKISNIDDLTKSDTLSYRLYDKKSEVFSEDLTGSFLIKLYALKKYNLSIDITDVYKKTDYLVSVYSDKSSKNVRENFLVQDQLYNNYFNQFYKPSDQLYFSSDRNQEMVFQVDYFKSTFKLAPPPFSVGVMPHFNYKPDSSFIVNQSNSKFELNLPVKGFYHVKTNEQTKEGLTFFVFENTYPKIKNSEQMILATRFIMSKKEFDACMNAVDKKASIDKFWLDIAGSEERAKELIRKYYGRVQEANKLFLSYQEGWKTDRGMIYIVFGAPNKVTKYKEGEVWTYGETGNSTIFSFIKVENPFTNNDFYLERNETLKLPWYQSVDMWRQGRVYLDN